MLPYCRATTLPCYHGADYRPAQAAVAADGLARRAGAVWRRRVCTGGAHVSATTSAIKVAFGTSERVRTTHAARQKMRSWGARTTTATAGAHLKTLQEESVLLLPPPQASRCRRCHHRRAVRMCGSGCGAVSMLLARRRRNSQWRGRRPSPLCRVDAVGEAAA